MPMYYFNLKTQQGRDLDSDGVELLDDTQAKDYGQQVARELMQQRETKTRSWRLEICNAERRPIDELLFVYVDPLVAALSPAGRNIVEQASARTAALMDAILDTRRSYYELKATLSESEGKPYLASRDGATLHVPVGRKGDSRN